MACAACEMCMFVVRSDLRQIVKQIADTPDAFCFRGQFLQHRRNTALPAEIPEQHDHFILPADAYSGRNLIPEIIPDIVPDLNLSVLTNCHGKQCIIRDAVNGTKVFLCFPGLFSRKQIAQKHIICVLKMPDLGRALGRRLNQIEMVENDLRNILLKFADWTGIGQNHMTQHLLLSTPIGADQSITVGRGVGFHEPDHVWCSQSQNVRNAVAHLHNQLQRQIPGTNNDIPEFIDIPVVVILGTCQGPVICGQQKRGAQELLAGGENALFRF